MKDFRKLRVYGHVEVGEVEAHRERVHCEEVSMRSRRNFDDV